MKVKQILWTILFVASSSVSAVKFENNSLQNLVGLAWTLLEKSSSFVPMHPDTKLNVPQFLAKYHYPLECHDVTTEDGYILTMHRIPHGRRDTKSDSEKPVVFFKHCFMCSSRDWLLLGPTRSLPMILADQGYDVWLANTRGNLHSMKHKTLNPDTDSQFWDFSFHEKGYYDLPASIDYVIETTKSEKITYIGHSQGTTEAMVLTSTRPEYNEKFYSMILLSPVVYLEHVKSPLILLMTQYRQEVESFLYGNNIYGIPWNPWISVFAQKACNIISPFHHICVNILELIIGYDLPQLDRFLLTVLLSYTPAGFSVKELIHFGQAITSAIFRRI
ncbi:lipase 3-like isoform X2 [Sitophilus oryzae]|uniref:Lipase 3-like isoform X2 n=1 Tax=Sitophilus oryzae TaxID=7048 RepID=A0A6J2XHX7_SITOR|nr:lipase 3-like isoform X2 [Sitophilus oryzae]